MEVFSCKYANRYSSLYLGWLKANEIFPWWSLGGGEGKPCNLSGTTNKSSVKFIIFWVYYSTSVPWLPKKIRTLFQKILRSALPAPLRWVLGEVGVLFCSRSSAH